MKTNQILFVQILIVVVAIADTITGADLGLSPELIKCVKLIGLIATVIVGQLTPKGIENVKTYFKK